MMLTGEQDRRLLLCMLGTLLCDGVAPMVDVAVVDEDGAVRGEQVAFPGECLEYAYEHGLPCLRFVDPHGDTVFNRMQVSVVLEDIERLARECSPNNKALLSEVRRMCMSVAEGVHLYLKFIGD